MRFFCCINTILMQCLKISSLCAFAAKLGKVSVNLAFIPGFKPHAHKLFIIDTALILLKYMLDGLLVPDSTIFPVITLSALTRFITYIDQFLNYVLLLELRFISKIYM